MEKAVKTFFSSPRFAVAGASADPSKFGHRVFAWYATHNLPVTPINPSTSQIEVRGRRQSQTASYPTAPSPSGLSKPTETSLSIITPPKVTRKLLEEAKKSGIHAVWLQPGSFDQETLEFARKEFPDAAVAGQDVPGSRGGDGWCVLVDGEYGMRVAGRNGGDAAEAARL